MASLTPPMPPVLQSALAQVQSIFSQVEGRPVDLDAEPWAQLEKIAVKVFLGPFKAEEPQHQLVALGLSAAFGNRLITRHKAFWFPTRETPEGAALGFAEALIMISPFGAVAEALAAARLERLDEVAKDLGTALGQAKFGAGAAAPLNLTPETYMQLFDPALVQLVALDMKKVSEVWGKTPERLSVDLRDAIGRAPKLTPELRKQLDAQLVGALARLEPGKPLLAQAARAPRVLELMALLFGATQVTSAATEEFWSDVVLPLAFIGAPGSFPALEAEELAELQQGVDPFFVYLEVVPYAFPSPEGRAALGVFDETKLSLPDPAFQGVQSLRLIGVDATALKQPLAAFDEQRSRQSLQQFRQHVQAASPSAASATAEEARTMQDAAMTLVGDLKRVVTAGQPVFLRRLTDAEAASEQALALVRQATQAPRIILTT